MSECIEWKGTKNYKGYGVVTIDGKQHRVHRLAVVLSGRTIPPNKVCDHICRNRACINAEHIRIVTNVENVMAGESFSVKNAAKTHCLRGHPYDQHGRHTTRPNGKVWRMCKLCAQEQYRAKRKNHGK